MQAMEGLTVRWLVIRLELAIGTLAPVLIAWLWLNVPPPLFGRPYLVFPQAMLFVVGMAMALAGAAWIWRIWWVDLEGGAPPWRYRAGR